jgi:CheY-like chemotaxis protein
MRDAQTMSFREWFLRRLRPPAAINATAQAGPAVAMPTRSGIPAPVAPASVSPSDTVAPGVKSVPVLALAPDVVPVTVAASRASPEPVTVTEPHATIAAGKLSGPVPAGSATRVLLIASDRRFRTVAATLLTQRGYAVAVGGRGEDITELAVRERADVVIIDASTSLTVAAREAARLGSLRPRVGVVAVSDGSGHGLAALPVLPKWSSFDEVFEAIDRVCPDRSRAGVTRVTS